MAFVNRLLFVSFVIVLGSHTFLSRGLDYDGSHDLFYMTVLNDFYIFELPRKFSQIFYQLPAYLFIKFSPILSLSFLKILYSFGLIWIHIISITGCFLILPKGYKNLLFFPLFAFLTGPMTGLGMSASVGLSVCSYIWLTAFILYYSDLSLLRHRLLFFLVPFPLLLSHELTSYMALPLVALCILKYQKESVWFNKLLIKIATGILILSSLLAFFLFFLQDITFDNRKSFFTSLIDFEFIYFYSKVNFPIVISLVLIICLFLSIFFQNEKNLLWFRITENIKKNSFIRNLFSLSLITWFREKIPMVLFILISFMSCFFLFFWFLKIPIDFPMEDDYRARVWIPCLALPLNFLLWWFFKEKMTEFCFKRCLWFLLSLVVVGVTFTSWRLRSDWLFYRHRVEFSRVLSRFQGIQEWNSVQDEFSNVIFNGKLYLWKITPISLMYPVSRTVKTVLVWPYSDCMSDCIREKKRRNCSSFCEGVDFSLREKWLSYFSQSRFFDFSSLQDP